MGKSEKEEKIKANLEKFNKMAAELDDERSKKKKSKKSKKEHRKREHTPEKEVSIIRSIYQTFSFEPLLSTVLFKRYSDTCKFFKFFFSQPQTELKINTCCFSQSRR